jgi:hypothetical protein
MEIRWRIRHVEVSMKKPPRRNIPLGGFIRSFSDNPTFAFYSPEG